MLEELFAESEVKMDKAIDSVENDLRALRTGRASIDLVDGVKVLAYGSDTPLNQVATVSAPDAATITVQPWDTGLLASVEKALTAANLGMMPNNDGKIIRLNVPPMTEESRKDMVKKAHEIGEHGKVVVRNVRRVANDEIKKNEKSHDISEDEKKRFLDRVQKHTDAHTKRIDGLLQKKEEEIMHV